MEAISYRKLHVVSGSTNLALAEAIVASLGIKLGETNIGRFANGEIHCQFGESVRGVDIFILQSHGAFNGNSVNDSLMEQILMVDAARRASAQRITAVCPFFGYARQDRKAAGREPISAKLCRICLMLRGRAASSAWISTRAKSKVSLTALGII